MNIIGVSTALAKQTQASDPTSNSGTTDPASSVPDGLGNEDTFLHLLVAQIQNQDPLNPTDSTQFVGQIVQFSSLEQLLGINSGIQNLVTNTKPTTPPASN
jgi:flagellar basal-body rod modification protein FlgD